MMQSLDRTGTHNMMPSNDIECGSAGWKVVKICFAINKVNLHRYSVGGRRYSVGGQGF